MLAGQWEEARRIVDGLIPGYERSPYWIESVTRVCRARMLIAEGAVAEAVADAERAVELCRAGGRGFQFMCDPLAFRARLHTELGDLEDAAHVANELLNLWDKTRGGHLDAWVVDLWFAVRGTGNEARLQQGIDSMQSTSWLEAVASLIRRDFDAAAERLDHMGAASAAALARLWGAEWLVEQGRRPEANVQLERSLAFWRPVGATRYLRRSESLLATAS
jgi:hypothetical protein